MDARQTYVLQCFLVNITIENTRRIKMNLRRRDRMGKQLGDSDPPLAKRLEGLRACLAFIREEALSYGEDDVAGHLDMACQILDGSVARLFPPSIQRRLM